MATKSHESHGPVATANVGRRQFLEKVSIALGGLGGALLGLPVAGFLLAPLLRKSPEQWVGVGAAESFEVGKTVLVSLEDPSPLPWAGVTARSAAWLRRTQTSEFVAFSVNCTHLGCPVRWLPDAELFMCPCHGGVFYQDGQVAAGPPPRPLHQYEVRVNNGQVEIRSGDLPVAE